VWEWRDLVHVEGTLGSGDGPYAVALVRQYNSYVTDSQHFRILKLTADGTVAAQWAMPGDRPAGESSSPHGVAVDALGDVYVAEAAAGRVQQFSSDGKSVGIWDLKERGLGELFIPGSLSIDQGGFVYLAEAYNDLVVKFDPGTVYVGDTDNKRVERLIIVDWTLSPPPEE